MAVKVQVQSLQQEKSVMTSGPAVQFEEYRLFTEYVQRLSERRQLASQTYLAVNTAVFTVLAFLTKDAGFRGWGLVWVSIPLFLVGFLACVVWLQIIVQYRQIIGWHYEQLRAMEQDLPGSAKVFSRVLIKTP